MKRTIPGTKRTCAAAIAAVVSCAFTVAGCGDDGPGQDVGDDVSDGGASDLDISGDWAMLRYQYSAASAETPAPADLGETRFVQTGSTFTQLFAPDFTDGVSGTVSGNEYVQTDGTFTAQIVLPDADHGDGTFVLDAFTFSFALVRLGAADFDIEGDWLADEDGIDESIPLTVSVSDDTLTVVLEGQTYHGRLERDTALLLADPQPTEGSLAAVIEWSSASNASATLFGASWTPDGAGHLAFETSERELTLRLPSALEGSPCDDDEVCPGDLYCVAGTCWDGSTGDTCASSADCLLAEDLCRETCQPRAAGDSCGVGDACPSGLYCLDFACRDGSTGDRCNATPDCLELTDSCGGDPAVCEPTGVLVPEGTFLRGTEEPRDEVTLTRRFLLDATEVTQREWDALMDVNPSFHTDCLDCPVEQVTLYDAMVFANTRSAAEGLPPCYELDDCSREGDLESYVCDFSSILSPTRNPYDCEGYRLPTDAEWEHAARAGTTTATYNGDPTADDCDEPVLDSIAWYCGNSGDLTHPVALKAPNALGLYDMLGNVAELTGAWEVPDAASRLDPVGVDDPVSQHYRRYRGGAISSTGLGILDSGFISEFTSDLPWPELGFRLARTLPGEYGLPCDDDDHCRGDMYCAQGACQDGRAMDFCGRGSCQSGVCASLPEDEVPAGSRLFGPDRCAPAGFALVPGGEVLMGSPSEELGREASGLDETVHEGVEHDILWVGETEVTRADWLAVEATDPSSSPTCGAGCPVDGLSFRDAVRYANARSLGEGLTPCYYSVCDNPDEISCSVHPLSGLGGGACSGYRLPSETEWEYLARAGSLTATYAGNLDSVDCRDAVVSSVAWFCGNSGGIPHPVATRVPNDFGLFDMLGSAAEWTWDWAAPLPETATLNYSGPSSGTERILRGGSYLSNADRLRSASRESGVPNVPAEAAGIRLVRSAHEGAGAPCYPFTDDEGCRPDQWCVHTRRMDDGVLHGTCASSVPTLAELDAPCDSVRRCGEGLTCHLGLGYCVRFCDAEAEAAEPGHCGATHICNPNSLGVGSCLETCDPFDPFPVGGCPSDRWCAPSSGEVADGFCQALRAGSGTQGESCEQDADCSAGHDCENPFGCVRFCDPDGEASCTAGNSCHRIQPPWEAVGLCLGTCDFDHDVSCRDESFECLPDEFISVEGDLCVQLLWYGVPEPPLEPLSLCEDAGLQLFDRCDVVSYCLPVPFDVGGVVSCVPICRPERATAGVRPHPDCVLDNGEGEYENLGACVSLFGIDFGGDEFWACEYCSDPSTAVLLDFDENGSGSLFGNASVEAWADHDLPNVADEGGDSDDGDNGLALQGWFDAGEGGVFQHFSELTSGTATYLSADMHIEPDFDPAIFELKVEWWSAADGGELVDETVLDLLPLLTPAENPADLDEWLRVGVSSTVPAGAVRGTVVVYFAGTTNAGTLQAARVDNVAVVFCTP